MLFIITTTTTLLPRSCHLAVAEDRLPVALPAQSPSLPVVRWTGSVDRVVRPHAVYPIRSKSSGTAHIYGGFGVVSRPKSGRLGSVAKRASTTSLAPPRQKATCAIRRRSPVRLPLLAAGCSFDFETASGLRGRRPGRGARTLEAVHDRREHGQLLQTAQATPPRLPLLFSWVPGRLPCVCVPTCPTLARCALKALGAFFTKSVHARFLGCYVVVTNPSPSRCCATMARAALGC